MTQKHIYNISKNYLSKPPIGLHVYCILDSLPVAMRYLPNDKSLLMISAAHLKRKHYKKIKVSLLETVKKFIKNIMFPERFQ